MYKSSKFILYSKFINKCKNLYNNFKDINGIYPNSIKKINDKILKDLKNGNIIYEILRRSMVDDKEFRNKISLITSDENENKLLFEKLKNNFEQCQKDFNSIEIILEYYSTFFKNSKEDLIKIIKKSIRNTEKIKILVN